MRLVQITAGIAEGDAVTNYVFRLDKFFRKQKIFNNTTIFAEAFAGKKPTNVHHLATYTPRENDVIIYHHSVGLLYFDSFLLKDVKPLIVYHNITPSHFYVKWDFRAAARMDLGRHQLHRLAKLNLMAVALSEFSASELLEIGFQNVTVLPYPIDTVAKDLISRKKEATPKDTSENKRNSNKKNKENNSGNNRLIKGKDDQKDQRWRNWCNESVPYLLFVGRIAPNKGIDHLLKAFKQVKNQGNYRLIIVGSFRSANDSYGSYLRHLVSELKLESNVCWTGYVDDQELSTIRKQARVFVSLSEHEGFGVPFVEAMASQLPILAYCSKSSSVAEVLGGAGIGFSVIDYEWISKVVIQLIHDSHLRSLVVKGQNQRLLKLQSINVLDSLRGLIQEFIDTK